VNVENGTSSAPDGLYLKGETVDVTVTGQNAYTFDHWEGDTNGCVFVGYSVGLGFTVSIPADADRSLTAVLANRGAGVAKLSIISLLTNSVEGVVSDTNGVEGVYGKSVPVQERETTENFTAGGKVMLTMDDVAYTNVVDDMMVVWVCSGWKLFADDNEHTNLLAEGTGRAAEFTFTCDSKFVWVWTEKATGRQRSPLPDTLEGPNGTAPLVVESGRAVAQIANTAYGWWYGLYSKVSLTDPNEEWTLVPDKVQLQADDDNVLITLEVVWDPSEPAKFFKVIVTEDDPR